jgi:PPK2 family polyphosphate:nucleotide phosphotransferase
MKSEDDLIAMCCVPPGSKVDLRKGYDPGWAGDPTFSKSERKRFAQEVLAEGLAALAKSQELLYAADSWSILIILQAMDAAGKDGTIKHVMTGVNPQGVEVYSFKHPSAKELDHDFLWRCARVVPERGRIGIFNRSYYEDVLIVRVHPELLESQRLPKADSEKPPWKKRFESINNFEQHLTRNGTLVLKFFLHISKDEQRRRFLDRLNDPEKQWKYAPSDLAERGYWDDYMHAYEQALSATSTKHSPWYVIPADHKWVSRALVASIVVNAMKSLPLKYPEITPDQAAGIELARQALESE